MSNPLKTFDIKAAHESLLEKCYGIDPSTGNPTDHSLSTTVHRKYNASQDLFETAKRLSHLKERCNEYIETLMDDNVSKTKKRCAQKFKDETLLPALEVASDIANACAKRVSPIARSDVAHAREEVKRFKDIANANPKCEPKVELMKQFIENRGSPSSSPEQSKRPSAPQDKTTRRTLRKKKGKKLPRNKIIPPEPKNGVEYGVGEFINIVTRYPKSSHKRGRLLRDIMSAGYVKRSRSTVYEALRLNEVEGKEFGYDEEWKTGGAPALMDDDDLKECSERLANVMGRKDGKDQINAFLREKEMKNGRVPDRHKRWNDTTLSNYLAILAKRFNLCLNEGSIPKTNARYTAENSLIGAMAQLIVVSMTHFYVAEEEDVKWRQRVNGLHEEDQFLYKLVSHFHSDRPIRARHPSHIISCDDFTDYICEGIQPDRSTDIGLIARASLKSKATDSTYHHDNSNKMNGRRLKHHVIGNGCGDTAQTCISMYVTDAEMPDTDFMVMEVDGLSKSGCELGDNSESGRVLLLKGTPGAEKRRFAWIRDNILFPFVEKIRKKYDGFNPDTGALPSGEEHTVVVWCDGDTSQINTATSEEGLALYKEKNIIVNKHNAAGTATQQPMDKSKVFTTHKRLNKNTTVKDVPADCHLLKGAILSKFNALSRAGTLRLKKQPAVVDYFAKLPRILATSRHRDNVIHGFVEVGFLDTEKNIMPVFLKIIGSRKTAPTQNELAICVQAFLPLMDYSYNNGKQYISDAVFISHGFPADTDMYNNVRIRTAGITQENQQRAKCLTGAHAASLRKRKREEIELDHQEKETRAQARVDRKRDEEVEIIKTVCEAAGLDPSEDNVAKCEKKDFDALKSPGLISFIFARHPTLKTKSSIQNKYKKPRTALKDALENGAENLISIAYSLREVKSRLLAAIQEDEDTPEDNPSTSNDSPSIIRISLDPTIHDAKPSKLINDPQWRARLWSVLDPQDRFRKSIVDEDLAKKSDLLLSHLHSRLKAHISSDRIPLSKKEHWCLEWARKNLSVVAVYMVLLDHVKKDISCISHSKCLLAKPNGGSLVTHGYSTSSNFLLCTNTEALRQGCYLYYDTNEDEWIRSGKVTGPDRHFLARHLEHTKRAEDDKNIDDSDFYDRYPSLKSRRANSIAVDGNFENLRQFVGAAFSWTGDVKHMFQKDYGDGGIFGYTKDDIDNIQKVNFRGRSNEEKLIEMAGYLFELGYELALSRKYNVSQSPGFEGCGLRFQ